MQFMQFVQTKTKKERDDGRVKVIFEEYFLGYVKLLTN